jgi:hypothetical protein
MINNEFCILCTGFSYSRQLILKRGSKISLKNIYYWSTILNNGLFSSINYVWNKIDHNSRWYTINDGIVYFETKLRFFNYL